MPNRASAFVGSLIIAALLAYATHWAIGLLIAFIAIYQATKPAAVGHTQGSKTTAENKNNPLSVFGTIFKMPDCYESKQEINAIACDITGNSGYDFEVVGESHYHKNIWACIPEEFANADKFRLYFIAALFQDDDNEHDANAVAVKINGGTVGHLPRTDAKRFRRWATKEGLGRESTCRAVIVGNKGMDYSIWLDLPIQNAA